MVKKLLEVFLRVFIIVASEKGGVRKTSISLEILDYLRILGIKTRTYQIDHQARLASQLGDDVTTIVLPNSAEVREDDLADASACEVLRGAFADPSLAAVVTDVGANFDSRLCDYAVATEWAEDLGDLGVRVVVVVPMTSDEDAILLGVRTMRRMRISFPDAAIIPAICRDGGREVPVSGPAKVAYDEEIAPLYAAGQTLVHGRMYPAAMQMLDLSRMSLCRFANLSRAEIGQLFPGDVGRARQARADAAVHIEDFFGQLDRLLPFRKDQA